MKTINDIAVDLGVTRQTVYERVRCKGVKLDSLTRKKVGKQTLYDDDAVKVIVSCVREERVKCKEERVRETCKADTSYTSDKTYTTDKNGKCLEELMKKLEEVTRELEASRKREEEARQEIERLQQETERLRAIEEEQRHQVSSLSESIRLERVKALGKLEAAESEKIGFVQRVKFLFTGKK